MIFASLAFIAMIFACWVMWSQQRTIDRLTDKLMAKDYSEYKRHDKLTEVKEERARKPLSYYDDTSIEDETH
ncbi:hypothetical protein [Paenibacillus agaridevorans]|uniref:hypothetical protein n=1 Tax=Paenibacillus agaridevorans TaxID=171404 RepID=UPI001BE3F3CA|nr:hypothetical protein [Paenibacillus agaridevorans]